MRCARLGMSVFLLVGCNRGKTSLGSGPEMDARLISDVYTWTCETSDGGETYQGVYEQEVVLQYAPDALPTLELPSPGGCSAALNMFPEDAGDGGVDLPGLNDDPRWETDVDGGELGWWAEGCYYDEVFENVHGCQEVASVLSGGTALVDAGALTGVATPEPAEMPTVTLDGDFEAGIPWGTELTASWSENDWEASWIQIRRERDGTAWESVTCNTTGQSGFTVDEAVWSLMNEDLNVEINNLFVAFEMSDRVETDDGQKVEVLTRAMAVTVVQD